MNSKRIDTLFITHASLIAAVYTVITIYVSSFGLANGAIQIRLSEALCILPVFTGAAVPGLFIGCLISNILTGCVIWDIVFGSIATGLSAYLTYRLRDTKVLYYFPPIVLNALIISLVLHFAYGLKEGIWFLILTVGLGELISVGVFGTLLKRVLWSNRHKIFRKDVL